MNKYRPKTNYIQAMVLNEQNLLDAMILTKGKILSLPLRLEIVDQNGTIRYEMKNSQSKSPEKKKSVLTLDQLYDDEKCQKLMVWLEAAEAKATKGGNKFDVESFVRERATVGTDCMDELVRTYDQYKQDKQQ